MTQPNLIVSSSKPTAERATATIRPSSGVEWTLIGGAGALFLFLGLMDLALVWYPAALGSSEWEFASITATLNGLPVPALGALLIVASGVARRNKLVTRTGAIMLMLGALLVVGFAILYATTVPIALGAVKNGVVRTGLLKAIGKTSVQCVIYPLLFLWVAIKGWRAVR